MSAILSIYPIGFVPRQASHVPIGPRSRARLAPSPFLKLLTTRKDLVPARVMVGPVMVGPEMVGPEMDDLKHAR